MTYQANTRVLPVNAGAPDSAAIAEAAAVLRRGGLVAFPTETVYGLGANALDEQAVSHIFAAKGRPASDPLIVHVDGPDKLEQVAVNSPPLARQLIAAFWPGPLTLVLERGPNVPANVTAGSQTVGVRMPRHPVALALLAAANVPVAAPSANLFARPSPTTAAHVLEDLRGRVDLVLDAGPTAVGVESTVLDLTQTPPRVLRPGGVSLEALRRLIPEVAFHARYADVGEAVAGPGMLLRHYSPRARLVLLNGERGAVLNALQARARAEADAGRKVGFLLAEEDLPLVDTSIGIFESLGSVDNLEAVARRLFAALRGLDARGVDVIFARALPREGLGLAVWDRLVRAAEGRVIEIGP